MKKLKKAVVYLLVLALTVLSVQVTPGSATVKVEAAKDDTIKIADLKVNRLIEPLGIDTIPKFSWILNSSAYDKGQSAYRIVVASTLEKAQSQEGDLWDSGKTEGVNNYDIVYSGSSLSSKTRYYWMVQVWDESGNELGVSDISYFETGILDPEEWVGDWIGIKNTDMDFNQANWIWRRDGEGFSGVPEGTQYFRKNFQTDAEKSIINVYVGATADDEYVLYFNGEKVGENSGTDAWKNGKLFDVTNLVDANGDNVVAIEAYSSSIGYAGLLAKIEIAYSDESKDVIVSDKSWKMSKTEESGWSEKVFADSSWIEPDQEEAYGNSPWGNGVTPNAENAFAATVLRKEFELGNGIKEARAYISGLGLFEMKINGKLPDDSVLNPSNTQYTSTVPYMVYDVTDLLQQGNNAIGIELGNGFYNELAPFGTGKKQRGGMPQNSIWNWILNMRMGRSSRLNQMAPGKPRKKDQLPQIVYTMGKLMMPGRN